MHLCYGLSSAPASPVHQPRQCTSHPSAPVSPLCQPLLYTSLSFAPASPLNRPLLCASLLSTSVSSVPQQFQCTSLHIAPISPLGFTRIGIAVHYEPLEEQGEVSSPSTWPLLAKGNRGFLHPRRVTESPLSPLTVTEDFPPYEGYLGPPFPDGGKSRVPHVL